MPCWGSREAESWEVKLFGRQSGQASVNLPEVNGKQEEMAKKRFFS